jgi:hypothetical protein
MAESKEKKAPPLTKAGEFRATERGYAGNALVEPLEPVPPGVPVGSWMERVDGKAAEIARAVEEALDPQPDDIDLEKVKGDALTAHALTFGINRGSLSDAKLRDAVRAAHDKDRTQ